MAEQWSFPWFGFGPGQTKTGTVSPLVQWIEYDFDPVRGTVYNSEWDSPDPKQGYNFWLSQIENGISARARFERGACKITICDSTQTYSIDSWSIGSNDDQLSVFLNPNIINDLNANVVGGYDVAVPLLQQALSNTPPDFPKIGVAGTPWVNYPNNGATLLLWPALVGGTTDFRNSASALGYVIRHRTNISNRSLVNIADFGTGQIYTMAQLLSEVSSTLLWNNPCPPNLLYFIANFAVPPAVTNTTVGFFKDRSNRETAANNRIDIITEYTYVQANNSLYALYAGI